MVDATISSHGGSTDSSEHPVQIVKLEGTNRSCSRDGPAPDIILVSISAVAKRAAGPGLAKSRSGASNSQVNNSGNWHTDMNLAVVSYLLSWGLDEDMDKNCFSQLGLKRPDNATSTVSYTAGCWWGFDVDISENNCTN